MTGNRSAGLTGAEVVQRRAAGLANTVDDRSSRSAWEILRSNVFTLFNGLILALCLIVLVTGDPRDALFGIIIIFNSGIGIVQEVRAKRTLDRLSVVGEAPVTVVRDGQHVSVRPAELVRDDLILLAAGDRLVVDGTIEVADGLEIDESLLTGEADPVAKRPGDTVLSGSFAAAGSGSYLASKVGAEAYAVRLAAEAGRFSLSNSELRKGINRFIGYVTWLIVPIGLLLTISQLRQAGSNLSDEISSTVAGIVTMIPEGLVLLTSMAFVVGAIRLARRRCLVQELPAVETLARVDVLCVDKTGTLTEPGLTMESIRVLDNAAEATVSAALAGLTAAEQRPNPTMLAIGASIADAPLGEAWTAARHVPFSSARKWSGASFDGQGSWVIGAPDVVLHSDDPVRAKAVELSTTGLRVLVVGTVPPGALDDPARLPPIAALAIVVLRQHLRPSAGETIRYFASQDVDVKVISGDSAVAVGAIASELSIPGADRTVDARSLPKDPGSLGTAIEDRKVFGRVTPQKKREIVKALQGNGHTVAMTGDGVNDVLALKDADLGIAMGSGSGATRAVAQIVLLDDSFSVMPRVVAEGRRVLANIERVANLFLTKTVYAIVLSLVVALVGLTLGASRLPFPFLPRHLTLISALTIGIPAFVLAMAPSFERARPGFVPRVLRFAVPAGIACGLTTLVSYWLARQDAATSLAEDRTVATVALFGITLFVLALIARPYTWWRILLMLSMVVLFALVCAVPWTRDFFALDFPRLAYSLIAIAVAIGAGLLLALLLRLDHWRGTPAAPNDASRAPGK